MEPFDILTDLHIELARGDLETLKWRKNTELKKAREVSEKNTGYDSLSVISLTAIPAIGTPIDGRSSDKGALRKLQASLQSYFFCLH